MAKLYELTGIFLEIDEMDVDDETKLDTLDSIDWEHDFSEKIEKEVAILSLNFATLRCGILTVTLRARFRARLFYQAEWNV